MIIITITAIILTIIMIIIIVIMLNKLMLNRFSFFILFYFLLSLISLSIVTHCQGTSKSYLKSISKGTFESVLTARIFAHFTLSLPFFLCHIINQNIASSQSCLEVEEVFMFHRFDNQ